jgi:hypothetical protein
MAVDDEKDPGKAEHEPVTKMRTGKEIKRSFEKKASESFEKKSSETTKKATSKPSSTKKK